MKLYNTLVRRVEQFEPLKEGTVTMYSCGPTVYNNLHIGNLSAFIYADLLRRTLRASGYSVTAVMNITDVDDKTIRDSKTTYPALNPKDALKRLTQKYEDVFKKDIHRIGNDIGALEFIRATDTIGEMIALTQQLLDNGFAYPAQDGIYFSIEAYQAAGFTYGVLQKIDRAHEHQRITNDEYDKDQVSDFALWKKASNTEPSWPATFTHQDLSIDMSGRPGWHIECSAMSQKLLGVPFDIHTGGIDLKFPHHENEIAQSCGATGSKKLANYFIHNNHVLIDGKKMSKSLGNFYTLRDVEDRGMRAMAFRLLVLSSHYRSESNFTWAILEAAQNRLNNWQATADLRWQTDNNLLEQPRENTELPEAIHIARQSLILALQNDLDTPQALSIIDELFNLVEKEGLPTDSVEAFNSFLQNISDLLGINLLQSDITKDQKQLIQARESARHAQDWAKSDSIREQLRKEQLDVRDGKNGSLWHRL